MEDVRIGSPYMDTPLYPDDEPDPNGDPDDDLDDLDGEDGGGFEAAVEAAQARFRERRQWLLDVDTTRLLAYWEVYEWRRVASSSLARAEHGVPADHADLAESARRVLAEQPEVSALTALTANRRLADLLTLRRWYVIQDAREAGASWTQIGAALGVTKQGAHDWYRRTLAAMTQGLHNDGPDDDGPDDDGPDGGLDEFHNGPRAERALEHDDEHDDDPAQEGSPR